MDKTIYFIKFFWYVLKYLFIGILIVSIMIAGFYVARDTANVYIIVTEGMELRAGTILNIVQIDEMDKYFMQNYQENDMDFTTNKYDEFFIRDYEYKLKIESLWANPWENTATVKVVETMPEIDGEYPIVEEGQEEKALPAWEETRYIIELIRIDGAWCISQVTEGELLVDGTGNTN